MKGYCECGTEIDEVEFTQFGSCRKCNLRELAKLNILEKFLEEQGFNLTAKILKEFISDYIKINWKKIIGG